MSSGKDSDNSNQDLDADAVENENKNLKDTQTEESAEDSGGNIFSDADTPDVDETDVDPDSDEPLEFTGLADDDEMGIAETMEEQEEDALEVLPVEDRVDDETSQPVADDAAVEPDDTVDETSSTTTDIAGSAAVGIAAGAAMAAASTREDTAPPRVQEAAMAEDAAHEDDHREIYDDEHEDHDGGWSFAAKALFFLLTLIAGAALGIWGAPKLADKLPAGLEPVAAWLKPGNNAAVVARLDDLSGQIDAQKQEFADLNARLGDFAAADEAAEVQRAELEAAITAQVSDAISQSEEKGSVSLQAEIARALEATEQSEARSDEKLSGLAAALAALDSPEARQRLTRIEAAIEGQSAQFSALKDQLSGRVDASGAATAEAIDLYSAELDGVRAEMGHLSDQFGGLTGRVEEFETSAQGSLDAMQSQLDETSADLSGKIETAMAASTKAQSAVEIAQAARAEAEAAAKAAAEQASLAEQEAQEVMTAAQISSNVAQIAAALSTGDAYAEQVAALQESGQVSVPDPIVTASQSGAKTLKQLRAEFSSSAHNVIRETVKASGEEGGFLAKSQAFLKSQVATRSLKPQEGNSADAILSRAEEHLRNDDLAAALAEAESLPPVAKAAMKDWIDAARLRADAEAGLARLQAGLTASN